MKLIAGCDGGGTKCCVKVARLESGVVVATGEGQAGPANVATDMSFALTNVRLASRRALAQLELPPEVSIDRAVCALAGCSRVSAADLETRLKAVLSTENCAVVPDVAVLFASAEIRPPALGVVVGTGSIAWLQTAPGETFRAGGEGPATGDLGSGYWIGRQAVERGLLSVDADATTPTDYARLAPNVFALPENPLADQIVNEAAQHIAALVISACSQSASPSTMQSHLHWVCAGGVANGQKDWMRSVGKLCRRQGVQLSEPRFVPSPVDGALRLAVQGNSSVGSLFHS